MYKILKIADKDYKLEYSVEASLYGDCVEAMSLLMADLLNGTDAKQAIRGVSNLPTTALTIFYAGLLEHHGPDSKAHDVLSVSDAKALAKEYLTSNNVTWYDLLSTCFSQMGEDGFFKLTGLERLFQSNETEEEKQPKRKVPQDHKQKASANK